MGFQTRAMGDAPLRRELYGFGGAGGHPDRQRVLDGAGPYRHRLEVVELSLVVEDFLGQALLQDFVGLGETFPAGEWVNVVGDVLLGNPSHYAADESPAGKHVQLGELLGGLHRVAQGQHVADDAHLHALSPGNQRRRQHRTGRVDVEIGEVVFVDESAVEAQLLAQFPLIKVLAVSEGRQLGIAELVGLPRFRPDFIGDAGIGGFVKAIKLHGGSSPFLTPSGGHCRNSGPRISDDLRRRYRMKHVWFALVMVGLDVLFMAGFRG